MRKFTLFSIAVLCLCGAFWGGPGLWAQSGPPGVVLGLDGESPGNGEKPTLSRKFREIELGMSLEDLKESLKNDGYFNFRGDRDVSFLPAREQSLIETTGFSFIKRAFFQLRDGQLFIMAFSLNTVLIDHYSVFTNLSKKYGEPSYLDPKESIWETEDTRITLERPLTVKYIDKQVFDDIINESAISESLQVELRQDFLDEF
ncbi:MAG: hypothetical protein LBH43_15105 [Treponema sp.]|jgi:hypothetical protein|nr:hypothetical protein [Treponema sp.]